jgi:nucleoside-diphosphate-sugar epimerase
MHRSISRVVILGDGLLGSELVKQTGWDYISRKKDGFDITKPEKFSSYLIDNYDGVAFFPKYNYIVNCIAHTDTYSNNKDLHWDINYKAVVELSNFCKENKIKLVHISTDYVYTNSISDAGEDDIPIHGNNWYSYTKLLGDSYVQLNKNNLILRGTHKPNPFPYKEAWIDQIGNFDYVDVIVNLIKQAIEHNLCGVYNIGTTLKSIFNLASQTSIVTPVFSPHNVPKNISMNINKLINAI